MLVSRVVTAARALGRARDRCKCAVHSVHYNKHAVFRPRAGANEWRRARFQSSPQKLVWQGEGVRRPVAVAAAVTRSRGVEPSCLASRCLLFRRGGRIRDARSEKNSDKNTSSAINTCRGTRDAAAHTRTPTNDNHIKKDVKLNPTRGG